MERLTMQARVDAAGRISRRGFGHQALLASAAAGGALGLGQRLLGDAPDLKKRGKALIVLWMQGAPSQFETFSPNDSSAVGGAKPIATAAPGVQIAEFWPELAKRMKDVAVIRSLTSKEGQHQRATYQLHTGYAPSGGIKHPSLGSAAAKELCAKDFDLPAFVAVGGPSETQGFLAARWAPFRLANASALPSNTAPTVDAERFDRRLRLLADLEQGFAGSGAKRQVEDHQSLYGAAARMAKSPRLAAFDLSKEPDKVREKYGKTAFGNGCLLARRLVEVGVPCVEVQLGNWDTHDSNHSRCQDLAGQCDPAFAALIDDLKERGRLDDTLIVWMGEFGRTPKVNPRDGRDHFPKAFNAALAGGGIRGGQAIGKVAADGSAVAERPVTPPDLFATIYTALGLDPNKENNSAIGRPIMLADHGKPVHELLGKSG